VDVIGLAFDGLARVGASDNPCNDQQHERDDQSDCDVASMSFHLDLESS